MNSVNWRVGSSRGVGSARGVGCSRGTVAFRHTPAGIASGVLHMLLSVAAYLPSQQLDGQGLPGAHGMKVAGRPAHPAGATAALVRSARTLPGQGSSSSAASHGAGWQVPAGLGMSIADEKNLRPPIRLGIVTQVRPSRHVPWALQAEPHFAPMSRSAGGHGGCGGSPQGGQTKPRVAAARSAIPLGEAGWLGLQGAANSAN